jgi:hypothetical protein
VSYTKEGFKRKCLYIHDYLDKQLTIKAAELGTDKSQVLNSALALYFAETKGEKNER